MSGGKGRTLVAACAIALAACTASSDAVPTTTAPNAATTTTTKQTNETATTTVGAPADDDPWPSPRRSHGMVALGDGRLLLVAGRTNLGTARTYLADTWIYSTTEETWEEGAALPTPRSQFALTAVQGDALLMGGYVGDRFTYPGTWTWTGGSATTGEDAWDRIDDAGPLTSRAGSVAAHDIDSGTIVLFGGAERPRVAELPTNETWLFRNGSWSEVTPDQSPRPKSEGHPTLFELALVYDSESDLHVLMIGGDETWVYDVDTNAWEERSAPGLEADFMIAAAYDERLDRVVAYGGAPSEASNQTWLYDTNTDTWERVSTPTDPGNVGDHAMAYDPVTQQTFLFGGAEDLLPLDGIGDLKATLWSFDGTDWTLLGP